MVGQKKIKIEWELRQLLPPAIHEGWNKLSAREQNLISEAVKFCEEYTRERIEDSYYDSRDYGCDREHVDDK